MIDKGRRAATVVGVALLTAGGAWYCESRPPPSLDDEALAGRPLLEVVRSLRREIRELRRETLELYRTVEQLQAEQRIRVACPTSPKDAPGDLRFNELVCGEVVGDLRFNQLVGTEVPNDLRLNELVETEVPNDLRLNELVKLVSSKADP